MKFKVFALALLVGAVSLSHALSVDVVRNNNDDTRRTVDMTERKTATVSYDDGISLTLKVTEDTQGRRTLNATVEKDGMDHKDLRFEEFENGLTIACEGSEETITFNVVE